LSADERLVGEDPLAAGLARVDDVAVDLLHGGPPASRTVLNEPRSPRPSGTDSPAPALRTRSSTGRSRSLGSRSPRAAANAFASSGRTPFTSSSGLSSG